METILCPTDFSQSADNAISYANELAQRMHARLILFHSIYEPEGSAIVSQAGVPYAVPVRDVKFEEKQKAKLDAIQKRLEHMEGTPVAYETKLNYGITKYTIPGTIQEENADLVVLGNEEAEGLRDIFVGSVAGDIIKSATCPVLIIPPRAAFKPLRKIIFATDLRGEPFTDLNFVLKLAGIFEAEINFLHILTEGSGETEVQIEAELNKLRKSINYPHVTFNTEANKHIEEGISQFCRKNKADMLVMGYHPRSFWQDLFSQDYTQEMAYHTYLPMLIIHYRN
jgi:nucleotide-binding universal stress UspA family protein